MNEPKSQDNFLVGFLLGGSVATVVTLLFTPRKGSDNRKLLSKTAQALPEIAQDLASTIQVNTHHLSLSTQAKWHHTLARLESAIASGIEASQDKNDNRDEK